MASRTSEQHGHLLKELNEERLAALTRISKTLESLIDQLRDLQQKIPSLAGAARAHSEAAYNDLRNRAHTYRWYLDVQREAIGLRYHRVIDEVYEIPGPLEGG